MGKDKVKVDVKKGRRIVYHKGDVVPGSAIDVKRQMHKFNGNLFHFTKQLTGTRYAVVFFGRDRGVHNVQLASALHYMR